MARVLAHALLPARHRLEGTGAAAGAAPGGLARPGRATGAQGRTADTALIGAGVSRRDGERDTLGIGFLEDVVTGSRAVGLAARFATADRNVDDPHLATGGGLAETIHQILRGKLRDVVQIQRLHATADADDGLAVHVPFGVTAGVGTAAVHRHHVHRDVAVAVLAEERLEIVQHVAHAALRDDADADRGSGRGTAGAVDRCKIGRVVPGLGQGR